MYIFFFSLSPLSIFVSSFDDSFRPVRLELHVLSFPGGESDKDAFKFDNNLNYR